MRTVDEQLAALRRAGSGGGPGAARLGLALLLAAASAAALWTASVPGLLFAAFVGAATVAVWRTTSRLRDAAAAWRDGRAARGRVDIVVTEWSESTSCRASVDAGDGGRWCFEFVPQGWRPASGEFDARVFHAAGVAWPALVVVDDGILVPQARPRRERAPV